MAVLSNNGRLISTLPLASKIEGNDELLVQSNGITKRIQYSTFTSSILNTDQFDPYSGNVNFNSTTNKFTGSFYNPNNKSANLYTLGVRQNLTVFGTSILAAVNGTTFTGNMFVGGLTGNVTGSINGKITGSLTGSLKGKFIGQVTGSITSAGKSIFSNIRIEGGAINGSVIGSTSPSSIIGTTITANTGFTGDLTGDIYSPTNVKILENGTGLAKNSFFYGTSSYAIKALTASYAPTAAAANGLPAGGTEFQVLRKKSISDYDTVWYYPVTRSGAPSQYEMSMWNSAYALKTAPGFSYSAGSDLYVYNKPVNANYGLTGSISGVVTSPSATVSLAAAGSATVNADFYPSTKLTVNGSGGTVTINLRKGKTSTVYVNNTGAFTIATWNASINGGVSTTTIYWPTGTPPTITSGGKDIFTFTNVDNNVFGSVIQNFL